MQLCSALDSDAEGAFVLPGIDIERVRTPAVQQTTAATLEHHRLHRELFAVLDGDVAGYRRLIEHNDVDTVVRLRRLRRRLVRRKPRRAAAASSTSSATACWQPSLTPLRRSTARWRSSAAPAC